MAGKGKATGKGKGNGKFTWGKGDVVVHKGGGIPAGSKPVGKGKPAPSSTGGK